MRKFSAMFLFSLVIVIFLMTSLTFGAKAPTKKFRDRAYIPARLAPIYSVPLEYSDNSFPITKNNNKIALGSQLYGGNPDTIGVTAYDYQHNCTMGRLVEHKGTGHIHFDWTYQIDAQDNAPGRGVRYQAYSLDSTSGCIRAFTAGGKDINNARAGYCVVDVDIPTGLGLPGAHENTAEAALSQGWYDFALGNPGQIYGSFFVSAPTDIFGWSANNGVGPNNENAWPQIAQQNGTETVLHMCSTEGTTGVPQTVSYYRRVGPYGADDQTQDRGVWSDQRVIDTAVGISVSVVAQGGGDTVAIFWTAPCEYKKDEKGEHGNQVENDIYYAICDDQGFAWTDTTTSEGAPSIANMIDFGTYDGGNITNYDTLTSNYRAYCNLSTLYATDGSIHVVWDGYHWADKETIARRSGGLFHWDTQNQTVRTVVIADWDTGGSCLGHAWNTDLGKPSITECDGKYYIIYNQFGKSGNPCGDVENANKYVNGYLYMTASEDGGMNWDRAQRVTNTPETSHGCIPADMKDPTIINDCNSEMWSSSAAYGRMEVCPGSPKTDSNVIDIMYINDLAAGGCVQGAGIWTINPVIWWITGCRAVVEEPGYRDNAGPGYGECYGGLPLWADPGSDTTVKFIITNPGLLPNTWTITFDWGDTPKATDWISAVPSGGTTADRGGEDTILIAFTSPMTAIPPETFFATIEVNHQMDGATTHEIPVCFMVAENRVSPDFAVCSTDCVVARVYNTSQVGKNNAGEGMSYIDDCDTFSSTDPSQYIYDAFTVMSYVRTSVAKDDTLFYDQSGGNFTDEGTFRPLDTVVTVITTDYTKVTSHFTDYDSTVEFFAEYYFPKEPDSCEFLIKRLTFSGMNGKSTNGVFIGEYCDWDVPSDSSSSNESGFDTTRNLIYQWGMEADDDGESTHPDSCNQQEDMRYGGYAIPGGCLNAQTIDNATYIYSTGPYKRAAPLPDTGMYPMMLNNSGFSNWEQTTTPTDSTDSTYTDLSMFMTYGEYNITPAKSNTVVIIYLISKTGLADLQASYDKAYAWGIVEGRDPTLNETIIRTTCCDTPGDFNNDGRCNLGDAIGIINYVFKGADAPECMSEGDFNNDGRVNLGDAIGIINFVFKGADAPDCGNID